MSSKSRKTTRKTGKRANNTYVKQVARREAVKVVNRNIESKMFDHQISAVQIDASATFTVLNITSTITQGTDDNQYIGRKIKPSYLQIRGIITHPEETNAVRMVIIQDKVSGVALSGATIWQSVGNYRAPYSPFERTYDDTFNVLYDKTINFPNKDGLTGITRIFKIKIPGRVMRAITYKDAAGLLESGGLYFALISDSTVASHPYVDAHWRLHYKDA